MCFSQGKENMFLVKVREICVLVKVRENMCFSQGKGKYVF